MAREPFWEYPLGQVMNHAAKPFWGTPKTPKTMTMMRWMNRMINSNKTVGTTKVLVLF